MKTRAISSVILATATAAFWLTPSIVGAQRGPRGGDSTQAAAQQAPAGPTPRLANGKPDLSGYWQNPYTPNMAGRGLVLDPKTRQPLTFARQGETLLDAAANTGNSTARRTFDLPYTEWGLKRWKDYDPAKNGEYTASCLPFGMSRNINSPHGLVIVHHVDSLAFLFEQNNWFHWVPTNGMQWPADLPRSWNGVSTGHWDGDTLVIETTGFNGYTNLDTAGHPHSKDLKLVNTFTRIDAATMQHTVTVHDPKTFTQDWMNVRTWRTKKYPDVIMEYACEENNLENLANGSIKPWKAPDHDD